MKQGWEIKKLGDLCNLMTGGTPSRSHPEYFVNGTIKWLVSGDIHKGEIYDCDGRITAEAMANSNAKYLPINSVMIALNGQGKTRGTVAILRTKATCNQSLVSIYPKNVNIVLPEYIFCNLKGRYEEIRRITGDDDKDRRGLNMPLLRNIDIPLPPLPEQQRIVSILDEAFAAIDKAKTNAEKNLENAKELFDSYLQGVFEKKGEGWEEKTIGEIGNPKMCKRIFKEQTTSVGDIPFYKIGTFGKEADAYISKEIYDEFRAKYSFPRNGDVLISASGTIGRRVRYDGKPAYFQDSNIVWIENDENQVSNDFLFEFYGACNWGSTKGATISRLYNDNLKNIKISFPKSHKEQQTIVQQLNTMRAKTQKLEAVYQKKIADLEVLKKSLLQKAFAGELTDTI